MYKCGSKHHIEHKTAGSRKEKNGSNTGDSKIGLWTQERYGNVSGKLLPKAINNMHGWKTLLVVVNMKSCVSNNWHDSFLKVFCWLVLNIQRYINIGYQVDLVDTNRTNEEHMSDNSLYFCLNWIRSNNFGKDWLQQWKVTNNVQLVAFNANKQPFQIISLF